MLLKESSFKEKGMRNSPPRILTCATMRNGLYFFIMFFPSRVYVVHSIGVESSMRLPVRKVEFV